MNTYDHDHSAMGLAGLHPRLTVLQAAPHERTSLTEHLARLLNHAPPIDSVEVDGQVTVVGPDDLDGMAQEVAIQRVDDHARRREDLMAELRNARDSQTAAATRRDEAAARARRMAAHLEECDALVDEATHARTAADEAARHFDECQAAFESARERQAVVADQRQAATRVIEDARMQLSELESSEMDETTLRRRLEETGHELRQAQAAHDQVAERLQTRQAEAYERAEIRQQNARERAELVARIEAPLYDPEPVRAALAAFDNEIQADQLDPVAQGLAREWVEVCGELERIEAALPPFPTQEELTRAEQQLGEIERVVAELEATSRHARLDAAAREEIEAAHEAVLAAEETAGQSLGPDAPHLDADSHLESARAAEAEVLARHGYATYLDVVMAEPEPGEANSELLDALQARRQAEDTVASLWAATELPHVVVTLRGRRDRIYREAAELLCCDPGDRIVELLNTHPVGPPKRTQHLAEVLAAYGVYPVAVSVRDAALDLLVGIERELAARDQLVQDVERLDAEFAELDDHDTQDATDIDELVRSVHAAAADVDTIAQELEALDQELRDRTTTEERRRERVAAAEELRAQIAAVGEALERSDDEYESRVVDAAAAVADAETALEQATASISHAARKVRRISEALPPPLRPKAVDDPLAELPALREVLASETERAEAAVTSASRELEHTRGKIQGTQLELDAHIADNPTDGVMPADLRVAIGELISDADRKGPLVKSQPVLLDDPFTFLTGDEKAETLDGLAAAASRQPVVLLTDDATTLSWAISLPDEVGAVTGLPVDDAADNDAGGRVTAVVADTPGAVAPSP